MKTQYRDDFYYEDERLRRRDEIRQIERLDDKLQRLCEKDLFVFYIWCNSGFSITKTAERVVMARTSVHNIIRHFLTYSPQTSDEKKWLKDLANRLQKVCERDLFIFHIWRNSEFNARECAKRLAMSYSTIRDVISKILTVFGRTRFYKFLSINEL